MVIECPRGYTRVIPSEQSACPACGKNVRECADANPNLTRTKIQMGDRLPPHCHSCDSPTDRTVCVKRTVVRGQGDPWIVRLFIFFVSPLLAILFTRSNRFRQSVKIRLPQCAACASQAAAPQPTYVNFEEGVLTFIVHRNFSERVQQLNSR
jgi:hypothetical protein